MPMQRGDFRKAAGRFGLGHQDPNLTDEERTQRVKAWYAAMGVHCMTCHGSGYVTEYRESDRPQVRMAAWQKPDKPMLYAFAVACPDCDGGRVTPAELYARTARAAGISDALQRRFTFALWDTDWVPAMRHAHGAALVFAQKPRGGIVFAGPPGNGKTHLAVSIAQEAIQRGLRVKFATADDAAGAAMAALNDGTYETLYGEWAREVNLVVIDDYGTEHKGRTAPTMGEEWLERVIRHRTDNERPFVLTMNIGVADLSARLGSRFRDASRVLVVRCEAGDFRPRMTP